MGKRTETIDRFAELLADGASVADAERRLSLPNRYGNALLQRLRKKMGAQAV